MFAEKRCHVFRRHSHCRRRRTCSSSLIKATERFRKGACGLAVRFNFKQALHYK